MVDTVRVRTNLEAPIETAPEVTYTRYGVGALRELRRIVARIKTEDPMAPVTVIVPGNIAGVVARRHLAGGLGDARSGVAGIWVSTLARLAEQIATPVLTAGGRRPATRPVISAAIRSVLDTDVGGFRAVAEHPSTARALAHASTALRDIDDDAVEAVAVSSSLCRDVVRIHRATVDLVDPRFYDTTDLLHAATRLVRDTPSVVAEGGSVVLYLPQDLTRAETAFAAALAEHADTHLVVGLTGEPRADGAVLSMVSSLAPQAAAPTASPVPLADQILHASDSDDEIRCVVRAVLRTLRTSPAHRVAVLYAARDPYARLVHEHLGAAGITINGVGVRPVAERAASRLVLGLLHLARTGYRRGDVLRTLGELRVSDLGAADRGAEPGPVNVPRWERLTREAGVVSGDDWQTRLSSLRERQQVAQHADAQDSRRARALDTITHIDVMSCFMNNLRRRLEEAEGAHTWADTAQRVEDLLKALLPAGTQRRLPPEEPYALGTVERTLSGLMALDDAAADPTLQTLEELLGLELELALPRVGRFGEGVLVAPLTQSVGLDLDEVFVVGLSEDLCPGTLREDALLPEGARAVTAGQLPSTRRRFDTVQRGLLAALASAPRATASFPRGDLRRHTHRLPSRWLLPSLRHLSGDPRLAATEWERGTRNAGDWLTSSPSYAGGLLATDAPASAQEWRVRAQVARTAPADAAVVASRRLIDARRSPLFTRHDGNLVGLDGLPDFAADGGTLSPTALELYAKCPHAYFVQRVLRVEPVEVPEETIELSASDLGSIVHEAMDALVVRAASDGSLPDHGAPWTAAQREQLRAFGLGVADRYETEGRTGHPRLWARRRASILAMLDRMLTDDDAWRASCGARVVASELLFGRDDAPPVQLDLGSGRMVRLRGAADKVDQLRDGTLVVTDIKTASKRPFTALSQEDPVACGEKLQLPVYGMAARAAHGQSDTPVQAMYWFVGRDRGRVPLQLDAPLQDRYAETLRLLVDGIAHGLFPARAPLGPDFRWVQCPYCNPDGLGHATVRESWEAKRFSAELTAYTALVEPGALPVPEEGRP